MVRVKRRWGLYIKETMPKTAKKMGGGGGGGLGGAIITVPWQMEVRRVRS